MIKIISRDGKEKGTGIEDCELICDMEGCNGTQYVVDWSNGETTIICGKGLKWLDEETAQII